MEALKREEITLPALQMKLCSSMEGLVRMMTSLQIFGFTIIVNKLSRLFSIHNLD